MAAHEHHHMVTDEEYFAALSESGLALARGQAEEYLKQASQDEDEAYPTRDVVIGLFTIEALQKAKQDKTSA